MHRQHLQVQLPLLAVLLVQQSPLWQWQQWRQRQQLPKLLGIAW